MLRTTLPLLYGYNQSYNDFDDYQASLEQFRRIGRERENVTFRVTLIVITVILLTVALVGGVGNALVVYVFSRHVRQGITNLFITLLAGIDFTICLIDIPMTLYWTVWQSDSIDVICKLHTTIKAFLIQGSVSLLVLIAVDRFLLICFIPGIRIKQNWAYISILMAVIGGISLAVPMGLHIGVSQVFVTSQVDVLVKFNTSRRLGNEEFTTGSLQRNYVVGHCEVDQRFISNANYRHYTLFMFALFLTMFVIISLCYSILFGFIWLRRSTRSHLLKSDILLKQVRRNTTSISLYSNNNQPHSIVNPENEIDENLLHQQNQQNTVVDKVDLDSLATSNVPKAKPVGECSFSSNSNSGNHNSLRTVHGEKAYREVHRLIGEQEKPAEEKVDGTWHSTKQNSTKQKKHSAAPHWESLTATHESIRPLHVKTAQTLALVTVTFAVSYIPYLLIVNEFIWPENKFELARNNKAETAPSIQLHFKRILFYLYFLNSVANPIIYSCMNRIFRKDLRSLLGKLGFK